MTFLRKKWILLVFLSFLQPVDVYAGIEDDYRRQQKEGECSYENAQFFGKDYKYCVSGGYWTKYSSSGNFVSSTGVLNQSIKSLGYITKVKIEGDKLVQYGCSATIDIYNFDCMGPVKKNILGVKGRLYYTQKIESNPDNYFYYHKRAIAKRNLITKNNGGIFKEKNDNLGMCEDYKKAAELEPKNMRDAKTYYKIFCEEFIKKDQKKEDQLIKKDQNPRSWYAKMVGYEFEIRRLTQAINTNPRRSRLSDLFMLRGNAKKKLLETQLKRKLTKSDDNIGMCTDYKKGLALSSKFFGSRWNKSNNTYFYTKKVLKEYCKLSFWESIKFAFK